MNVLIVNGPNINLLSKREKFYSNISFKKIKKLINLYSKNILNINFYNSNCEGKIINFIHNFINYDYLIINPGAYSHYSISLLDCIKMFKGGVLEIHFTNIYSRDLYRKNSILSLKSDIVISGMGYKGYFQAINYIIEK